MSTFIAEQKIRKIFNVGMACRCGVAVDPDIRDRLAHFRYPC